MVVVNTRPDLSESALYVFIQATGIIGSFFFPGTAFDSG